jgi:hypothetical protein
MCSNAACHEREWTTASATLRSDSSERSRAGAEVAALAAQHDRARFGRQAGERGLQLRDQGVIERVALDRSIEPHMGDGAGMLDAQQVERGQCAGRGDGGFGHGGIGHLVNDIKHLGNPRLGIYPKHDKARLACSNADRSSLEAPPQSNRRTRSHRETPDVNGPIWLLDLTKSNAAADIGDAGPCSPTSSPGDNPMSPSFPDSRPALCCSACSPPAAAVTTT